jgi:hypothetical protein
LPHIYEFNFILLPSFRNLSIYNLTHDIGEMKDYKQVEKMYIYDKIPLEEIGLKLNISRRTLFYWKKKYE